MTLVEYESDLQLLLQTAAILPHAEHLLCSHDDLVLNSSTSPYVIYIAMQNDTDLKTWNSLAEVSCCSVRSLHVVVKLVHDVQVYKGRSVNIVDGKHQINLHGCLVVLGY